LIAFEKKGLEERKGCFELILDVKSDSLKVCCFDIEVVDTSGSGLRL
jgi:hypothetical protein